MDYATALDVGKRKREEGGINEDSVAVNLLSEGHRDSERESGVFVLADGAGGAQEGDVASYVTTVAVARQLADRLWSERLLRNHVDPDAGDAAESPRLADGVLREPLSAMPDGAVESCIEDAIQAAHTRLLEVVDDFGLQDCYSTVVAAVAAGDRLHYGWVGDSRAYVVNVGDDRDLDQRVTRLTKDHSAVEELVARGSIDEVEAHVHRHGNRITRALGGTRGEAVGRSAVDVDTATVPLFGDDVVLLTSDGLLDAYTGAPDLHRAYEDADDTGDIEARILEKSVTDDEIGRVVLAAPSLQVAADRLVDLSNERGGKDNVSVVLFRDESLPDAPAGSLPLRVYDPDPEQVIEWDTVKRVSDDPAGRADGTDAGRADEADARRRSGSTGTDDADS